MSNVTGSGNAEEALNALGLDLDTVVEADEALKQRGPYRDSRICICGHPLSRHTEVAGIVSCKPARMDCPCKKSRAVLEVDDTRMFLRRTAGGGAQHALSRGLSALALKGKSAQWIVDLKCDRCGSVDEVVTPVPVTQNGSATSYATGFDALLCTSCRQNI